MWNSSFVVCIYEGRGANAQLRPFGRRVIKSYETQTPGLAKDYTEPSIYVDSLFSLCLFRVALKSEYVTNMCIIKQLRKHTQNKHHTLVVSNGLSFFRT